MRSKSVKSVLSVIGLAILAGPFHVGAQSPDLSNPLPTPAVSTPVLSLIIDDLGDRWSEGKRAVALPGAVTYGILPFTPYARKLAESAQAAGKEIILHLPMQAEQDRYLGRGGLYDDMPRAQFSKTLLDGLRSIPHVRGINNHMGSRLTQRSEKMEWLMQDISEYGNLYVVDSVTTGNSQMLNAARRHGIAAVARDVFLDNRRDVASLQKQWDLALMHARQRDSTIVIAHPHPESLKFLETVLPQCQQQGVELIAISELIQSRTQRRLAWQTSSSPSLRDAKNSKPSP